MKKLLLLPLFFATLYISHAQIGISGSYQLNNSHDWKLTNVLNNSEEINLLGNGPAIGIDYWFRLKSVRIEFLPELNFARFSKAIDFSGKPETQATYLGLFFNTNFYFLDFFSDCDCPTWSKQSDGLAKGLFLQLSPGISMVNQKTIFNEGSNTLKAENWIPSIGAALGFDIGVSDLVTISPKAGFRYYTSTEWSGLNDINNGIKEWSVESEKSSLLQFTAGLRVGIRLDYR